MSRRSKRFRSLVITVMAIAATNFAISFAGSYNTTAGEQTFAKSGVPTLPDFPRPKSGVPTLPDFPRPKSGVPTLPDFPRP